MFFNRDEGWQWNFSDFSKNILRLTNLMAPRYISCVISSEFYIPCIQDQKLDSFFYLTGGVSYSCLLLRVVQDRSLRIFHKDKPCQQRVRLQVTHMKARPLAVAPAPALGQQDPAGAVTQGVVKNMWRYRRKMFMMTPRWMWIWLKLSRERHTIFRLGWFIFIFWTVLDGCHFPTTTTMYQNVSDSLSGPGNDYALASWPRQCERVNDVGPSKCTDFASRRDSGQDHDSTMQR